MTLSARGELEKLMYERKKPAFAPVEKRQRVFIPAKLWESVLAELPSGERYACKDVDEPNFLINGYAICRE